MALTLERAKELLATVQNPRVRAWDKSDTGHAARALLLGLSGSDSAIIKPHGHGREEIVKLKNLSEWKSVNAFSGRQEMKSLNGGLGRSQTMENAINTPCVIVNKTFHRFYCSHKVYKWVDSLSKASFYKSFGDASRAIYHLQKKSGDNVLEVMTKDQAAIIESQWNPERNNEESLKIEKTRTQPMKENITEDIKEKISTVSSTSSTSLSTDLAHSLRLASSIDLNQIKNVDPSELLLLIQDRKKILNDLEEAHTLFMEAWNKYTTFNERYEAALANFLPNLKSAPAPAAPARTSSYKRTISPNQRKGGRKMEPKALAVLDFIRKNSGKYSAAEITSILANQGLCSSKKEPHEIIRKTVYGLASKGKVKRDINGRYYAH